MHENKDKTLEYIKSNVDLNNCEIAFLIGSINYDTGNEIYGVLIISEESDKLDSHCEQCFNEEVLYFRFSGDKILCDMYLSGQIGLIKYNFFKNDLSKILGKTKIIEKIK